MEYFINHTCYTFLRQVLLWEVVIDGKSVYRQSWEVDPEIRNSQQGVFLIAEPDHADPKPSNVKFRPEDSLDLVLSKDAFQQYARLKNDAFGNPEDILNIVLVKKLESLSAEDAPKFLNRQIALYKKRFKDGSAFVTYTEKLLEEKKYPWAIKYSPWLEENHTKSTPDAEPRCRPLTSRQLAIAVHILEKTGRLSLLNAEKRKTAMFIAYISGLSHKKIEDQFSVLGDFSFTEFNTKSKKAFILKDFRALHAMFRELGFIPELRQTEELINQINWMRKKVST